jgi:glycosyltransferase involved in cell wall biosynthesis
VESALTTSALSSRKEHSGAAVLVSHGFQSDYEAGFANGLARNGVKVTLVASDQTLFDRLEPTIEAINLRGSQDSGRPAWRKAINLLGYCIRLFMLIAIRRPVTHLTGLFLFSNFSSAWAEKSSIWECYCLRLLSHRLILTVHNVVPHDRDTPKVRQHLAAVYRIPHCLVVHTAKAKQRLIDEFSIDPARILVMDHGLDEIIDPKTENIAATRAAMGYTPDQKIVLFLGWVRRYKGVDLLLEAARHLGDKSRVLIAGNCIDSDYQQEINQTIARHALAHRVTWEFGFLSEERVSALLSAVDVLVMPYRQIDQSGVLFAALRHGVPVVAFDVGSFKDYLPAGTGLIVPCGDTVALAAAIEEIVPARSARGHIHAVARKYRWQETAKSVLHVYQKRVRNENRV